MKTMSVIFTPNYQHTALFFLDGETFNQKESMISWKLANVADCVGFMLVHFGCMPEFWPNLNSS